MTPEIDLGRIAFESYKASCAGLTYDGKPIPGWDELDGDREATHAAWQAAGRAAASAWAREFARTIESIQAVAAATLGDQIREVVRQRP